MKLNRSNTMKRAFEFAHVRKGGQGSAGRFLVLSLATLPASDCTQLTSGMQRSTGSSRFGIIVTKKVGNAVVRNTLRRRVREIIRAHGDSISDGYRVVVILRHRANFATYEQMEKDFQKCLKRLPKSIKPEHTTPS